MLVLSSDLVASVERMREEFAEVAAGSSTSSSARSSSPRAITSRCSIWSASSTPISASPMATRAPPSAPSSFLHQVVGRAGRDAGVGHGYLQTHQPEHPVMRALIARRPRCVLCRRDRPRARRRITPRSAGSPRSSSPPHKNTADHRQGRLFRDAARRRHRLGQDRGLFGGRRRRLRAGRQALVLLPEIALSAQWLERFERRFGVAPAVWHSDLAPRARARTWRAVADGEAPVVVGARSALFLPFPDLGLIVVDEEHETAFKQEDGVSTTPATWRWCAAQLAQSPVVLVSATPSLETVVNVRPAATRGLRCRRGTAAQRMPQIAAIDLRETPPARGHFLAPPLVEAVETDAGARRAGAAVPQPPRLCAADAVPACGHRLHARTATPGWSSTASAALHLPPLRPRRCRSRPTAPPASAATAYAPSGRAWSGSSEEARGAVPRGAACW